MTQTTFTDNVLIEGSQDIEQLRVQGHTTQDDPLQTWEDSDENVLAQITGDGRLQIGDDLGMATPDSLIEAHRDEASSGKPKRGIHSLGQISGTLDSLVQWLVGELELYGSSAIDAIHTALRVRASNLNTGTPTGNAELRGADIEVINDASASTDALTRATGLQVGVTNATGKTITDAVGLRVKMNNDGTITNPYAIFTEGEGVIHFEDYLEVMQPQATPGAPDTDFIRIYPKSDGKLYAKNWNDTEYDLTASGGGGVSDHGALTGLSDDDHAQYLLASGLREWDEQGSNPSTPATDKWKLFFKSDGLYLMDDTGAVSGPLGTGGAAIPAGTIWMYGDDANIPTGWLLCDGDAVSRTTYATLFGVIGTTYGVGDGSTTFNLPDFRGRTAVGAGQGAGLSTVHTLGDMEGTETHTLTTNEIPAHTHDVYTQQAGGVSTAGTISKGTHLRLAEATTSVGGGAAHNNMQPYLAVNYIIKT